MRRPFIALLAALMAGIGCGYLVHIPESILMLTLLIAFSFILWAYIRKRKHFLMSSVLVVLFILGIFNIYPFLYQDAGVDHIHHWSGMDKITVDGMIDEPPYVLPDHTEIVVSVIRVVRGDVPVPAKGRVLLTLKGRHALDYGDVVRFRTKLRVPHNYNNPGGFDMEKRLRFQGILVRGFIADPSGIIVLRKKQGNIFRTHLENYRKYLKNLISQHAPSPVAEIIQASILGNQKEIPEAVMDKFNRTGTTHIIAISGFNIGIIALLAFFIIRSIMKASPYLLLRFNIIKVSTVFAIIPIIIFTLIAGAGISVVRATIMIVTFMVALLIGRERDMYNTLAVAAFLILILSPPSLFDVSFQLSFVAVASLIFMTPVLSRFIPPLPSAESGMGIRLAGKVSRSVLLFVIVSISATIGTLPLIVYYFNRISTVVLLSNLAVVPVLGIIAIPVCTAIIIVAPLSTTLAVLLIKAASMLVAFSLRIIDYFASMPFASIFVSKPNLAEIALYSLLIVSTVLWLGTFGIDDDRKRDPDMSLKRRWFAVTIMACLLLFILDAGWLYVKERHPGHLKITFIDVGQGSATLVRFPEGRKMLVDGGGSFSDAFDTGKHVLSPYLRHERIGAIDVVVLTHPHPDHLNGLIYILENFQVSEVWTSGEESDIDAYRRMIRIIREKRITLRSVSEQTGEMVIDGVRVRILNPRKPISNDVDAPARYDITNNNAVVIKMIYGDMGILLPSDISAPTEERLLEAEADIGSRLMQVPHHGGFTSSTLPFLEKVLPEIAVISAGKENSFGLPHPDVLRRLELIKAKVFRTDMNGAVTVISDGKRLIVDSHVR